MILCACYDSGSRNAIRSVGSEKRTRLRSLERLRSLLLSRERLLLLLLCLSRRSRDVLRDLPILFACKQRPLRFEQSLQHRETTRKTISGPLLENGGNSSAVLRALCAERNSVQGAVREATRGSCNSLLY